jgi:hypothetical protein
MKRETGGYRCPDCELAVEVEEDLLDEIKERLRELKAALSRFSLAELKAQVDDRESPVTAMLIGFLAWGVAHLLRFPILMAVVLALTFLLGPWGWVLAIVLPLVYRKHRHAVEQRAEQYRAESKRSRGPSPPSGDV